MATQIFEAAFPSQQARKERLCKPLVVSSKSGADALALVLPRRTMSYVGADTVAAVINDKKKSHAARAHWCSLMAHMEEDDLERLCEILNSLSLFLENFHTLATEYAQRYKASLFLSQQKRDEFAYYLKQARKRHPDDTKQTTLSAGGGGIWTWMRAQRDAETGDPVWLDHLAHAFANPKSQEEGLYRMPLYPLQVYKVIFDLGKLNRMATDWFIEHGYLELQDFKGSPSSKITFGNATIFQSPAISTISAPHTAAVHSHNKMVTGKDNDVVMVSEDVDLPSLTASSGGDSQPLEEDGKQRARHAEAVLSPCDTKKKMVLSSVAPVLGHDRHQQQEHKEPHNEHYMQLLQPKPVSRSENVPLVTTTATSAAADGGADFKPEILALAKQVAAQCSKWQDFQRQLGGHGLSNKQIGRLWTTFRVTVTTTKSR